MKKEDKRSLILVGVLAVLFVGLSVFFALRGVSVANKEEKYFDVYRQKAKEYILSDSEILAQYGSDVSVKFDNSYSYMPSEPRGMFDRVIDVFAPRAPETLEEFNQEIAMIEFKVSVKEQKYLITFEKDYAGELVVVSLVESE